MMVIVRPAKKSAVASAWAQIEQVQTPMMASARCSCSFSEAVAHLTIQGFIEVSRKFSRVMERKAECVLGPLYSGNGFSQQHTVGAATIRDPYVYRAARSAELAFKPLAHEIGEHLHLGGNHAEVRIEREDGPARHRIALQDSDQAALPQVVAHAVGRQQGNAGPAQRGLAQRPDVGDRQRRGNLLLEALAATVKFP